MWTVRILYLHSKSDTIHSYDILFVSMCEVQQLGFMSNARLYKSQFILILISNKTLS